MAKETRLISGGEDLLRFIEWVNRWKYPFTATLSDDVKRSLSQNALVHKWYGEIARHFGDRSALDVKGVCHVEYGLVIRLRDPAFAWIWNRAGAGLPYEKQCALFAREEGVFAMTSAMTRPELTEYMDNMARDYRAQGVYLTDPEMRKYEQDER